VQAPLKYVITPLFYGVTAGPIYGGVTGIMMNMSGTPDMQARVLRHTAMFSSMGLAFGLAGLASMLMRSRDEQTWEQADDFKTRFTSGCAAGATLGLASTDQRPVCYAPFTPSR
jgi:predicted phage tail protein